MLSEKTISLILSLDDSEFAERMGRAPERFKQLEDAAGSAGRSVSLSGGILSAFGGIVSGIAVGALARDLVEAGMAAERMRNMLTAVTGSLTQGGIEMEFVRSEANRLGLDLRQAAEDYGKLAASAMGTKMQGEETRKIFSAISEASVTLGLSVEQTSGALTAIGQMMSKGTVQAEELRGQLGERLYGAFNHAAAAMGVTTQQLGEMLQKGEVVASDFLPKFGEEVRRTFQASGDATHSAQAEMNRFNTAMFEVKKAIMEEGGGRDALISLVTGATDLAKGFNSVIAEGYRFAMLLDKLGGTMTTIGYVGSKTAEIVTRLFTIGQFGDSFKEDAENFYKWNKLYEERYKQSDKRLQEMANLEAGLNADGTPRKVGNPMAPGTGGGGGGKKVKKKTGLSEDQRILLSGAKDEVKQFYKNVWDENEVALAAERFGVTFGSSFAKKTALTIKESGEVSMRDSGIPRSLLGPIDLMPSEDMFKARDDERKQSLEYGMERLRLEQETSRRITEIQYETTAARLSFLGDEQGALTERYTHEFSLLDEEYARKIGHARQIGMDTLLIEQEYAAQREQLQNEQAQRLADLWWNNSQTYINYAQQMTTMGVQMLLFEEGQKSQIGKRMLATSIRFIAQGLQQFMFGKAQEHLLSAAAAMGRTSLDMAQANANLGILEAQAVAWAAFFSAMSLNPYGGQAFIPAATAMTAVAGGAVPAAIASVNAIGTTSIAAELGMAALWAAGGIAVGALGEAGASAVEGGTAGSTTPAGYGGGSPGSPVVTQSLPQTQAGGQPLPEITIRVVGVITDAVVEDTLVPMINRAGSRNVKIEYVQ